MYEESPFKFIFHATGRVNMDYCTMTIDVKLHVFFNISSLKEDKILYTPFYLEFYGLIKTGSYLKSHFQ